MADYDYQAYLTAGRPALNHGDRIINVPVGSYTLEAQPLEGNLTPPNLSGNINNCGDYIYTANYGRASQYIWTPQTYNSDGWFYIIKTSDFVRAKSHRIRPSGVAGHFNWFSRTAVFPRENCAFTSTTNGVARAITRIDFDTGVKWIKYVNFQGTQNPYLVDNYQGVDLGDGDPNWRTAPKGIALSPDGAELYVGQYSIGPSNPNARIMVLNPTTGGWIRHWDIDNSGIRYHPYGLLAHGDALYGTCTHTGWGGQSLYGLVAYNRHTGARWWTHQFTYGGNSRGAYNMTVYNNKLFVSADGHIFRFTLQGTLERTIKVFPDDNHRIIDGKTLTFNPPNWFRGVCGRTVNGSIRIYVAMCGSGGILELNQELHITNYYNVGGSITGVVTSVENDVIGVGVSNQVVRILPTLNGTIFNHTVTSGITNSYIYSDFIGASSTGPGYWST